MSAHIQGQGIGKPQALILLCSRDMFLIDELFHRMENQDGAVFTGLFTLDTLLLLDCSSRLAHLWFLKTLRAGLLSTLPRVPWSSHCLIQHLQVFKVWRAELCASIALSKLVSLFSSSLWRCLLYTGLCLRKGSRYFCHRHVVICRTVVHHPVFGRLSHALADVGNMWRSFCY